MILPRHPKNKYLHESCLSRKPLHIWAYKTKDLPFFIEGMLAELLGKEIEFVHRIEFLKIDLMSQYGWNTLKTFNTIDVKQKKEIDLEA